MQKVTKQQMCIGCGEWRVTGDELLCPHCVKDGLTAYRLPDGDIEITFPEKIALYEVCAECGRHVETGDDKHLCPNWEILRGMHPTQQAIKLHGL